MCHSISLLTFGIVSLFNLIYLGYSCDYEVLSHCGLISIFLISDDEYLFLYSDHFCTLMGIGSNLLPIKKKIKGVFCIIELLEFFTCSG